MVIRFLEEKNIPFEFGSISKNLQVGQNLINPGGGLRHKVCVKATWRRGGAKSSIFPVEVSARFRGERGLFIFPSPLAGTL
ncbi:MAG: hypothetical protein ACKOGA_19350, partial [Planctomycetaceae bacterium]